MQDDPARAQRGRGFVLTVLSSAPPTAETAGERSNRATRLRVLFCTIDYYPAPAGGAERQALLQAEELVRRGHQVVVVCPRSRGYRSGTINGVRVHRLPCVDRRGFRTLTYLPFLAAFLLLRLRSFDLVHVHLANLQADVVVVLARLLRRPSYVKLACGGSVGEVARMSGPARVTRYVGLRRAERVQALSQEIVAELAGIGVEGERVLEIPNGLDVERFKPAGEGQQRALREQLGLPLDDLIVLFTGRFARYKGLHDLLAAYSAKPRPGITLLLVGSAETDRPMEAISDTPGLIVRGWTNDVVPYLQAADIFVVPSYADGMSNALLEAMGCGLAVIATRAGAAVEMIHPDGGILIDAGNRQALAEALEALTADPELRKRLGADARRAAERYAIPAVVAKIENAYRDMVTLERSIAA